MSDLLSMEQKQAILQCVHHEAKYNRLIKEDAYGPTPAYLMLDVWLGQVLGLQFKTEIYNSREITEINSTDRVKAEFCKRYSNWFVGDQLKDILFTSCYYLKSKPEEIEETEKRLVECWEFFQSLVPKISKVSAPAEEYEYVPTGVFVGDEVLYKKVKK